MKVCVIGDSHVGAIKLAYDALGPAPPHELTFFAALAEGIDRLELADGKLVPPANIPHVAEAMRMTSGGLSTINPKVYDLFLLIGMVGSIEQMVWTIARPLSEAVRACAVTDFWHASRLPPLLGTLRQITQKPVTVGFTPLLARAQTNDLGPERYARFLEQSNALFFSGFNVRAIGQPPQTIVNGHATKIEYSRMSERLLKDKEGRAVRHPEGETSHMNKDYGALWLAQFFAEIETNNKH